ncbi:MAG: hypothetical protein QXM96_02985 [Candidatus Woesearchaeota archaeon]
MARIRRSKTNTTFFMDIPKCDDNGRKWKKTIEEQNFETIAE